MDRERAAAACGASPGVRPPYLEEAVRAQHPYQKAHSGSCERSSPCRAASLCW